LLLDQSGPLRKTIFIKVKFIILLFCERHTVIAFNF
jgi:hypothetical protein